MLIGVENRDHLPVSNRAVSAHRDRATHLHESRSRCREVRQGGTQSSPGSLVDRHSQISSAVLGPQRFKDLAPARRAGAGFLTTEDFLTAIAETSRKRWPDLNSPYAG